MARPATATLIANPERSNDIFRRHDTCGIPDAGRVDGQTTATLKPFGFGGLTSLNDVIIPKLKKLFTLSHTDAMRGVQDALTQEVLRLAGI